MKQIFTDLSQWLILHQQHWRFSAFSHACNGTQPDSSIVAHLQELNEQEISDFKHNLQAANAFFSQWLPDIARLQHWAPTSNIATEHIEQIDGIPGRKLAQIHHFSRLATRTCDKLPWLEWCAGKGYLGQFLSSRTSQSVTSLEFQAALCQQGQQLAHQRQLPMTFHQCDVLSAQSSHYVEAHQHAVALHACGDLHQRLIELAVEAGTQAISIAPCCYHLTASNTYFPLSRVAQQYDLRLNRDELRIPLTTTVTGGERVRRSRQQEMSFRLGLDRVLRDHCGRDKYIPIPSIKKSLLQRGFEDFCRWAIEQKELHLPSNVDWLRYQEIGEKAFWQMERYDLLQQVFKQPLEWWLIYDKALYLSESNYQVDVSMFCDYQITPRNYLIRARLV
ncbi:MULTISPECIES: methyltransferase [unclassified Vibrio]|uniref:Methyltransferase n=1 Tax=Vibrio sp. HB236076 TaxID=3232307 RepID=A0AB39H752_9VIBR|nr:methyltransferase [Vibrio sp. HB161653]MDP5253669.1 methyltransferase [Vibrio sp. HB161653]